MTAVLVTGANGFVGQTLARTLSRSGYRVRGVVRDISKIPSCEAVEMSVIDGMDLDTDWSSAVNDMDVVVHLAARVHVMKDTSANPLAAFRRVNVDGTLALARQAAMAGVKRFVYLSSIKVNGEETLPGSPFLADDDCAPVDPYALSKYEAEQGLMKLARETSMEVVIIRPPLVYGPGVKANFLNMMRWLYKNIPLPLGSIHNRRSLVALENLVDFIVTCIRHPAAANQVFLVADGEDLSTTELLRRVALALGKKPVLLPVNQRLLKYCLLTLGMGDLETRLCGTLQVDISKARKLLNWSPPVTIDEGIKGVAQNYIRSLSR